MVCSKKKKENKKLDKDDTEFLNECVFQTIPIYAVCEKNKHFIESQGKTIFINSKDGMTAQVFRPAFYYVEASYQNLFHVQFVFKYVVIKDTFYLFN